MSLMYLVLKLYYSCRILYGTNFVYLTCVKYVFNNSTNYIDFVRLASNKYLFCYKKCHIRVQQVLECPSVQHVSRYGHASQTSVFVLFSSQPL